ncbi:MAG: nitroreductase family protein [Verrucomicrobiae bacterium]|nr:nitroreductase family protein [Verrucomicrobiae bacterium]
MDALEAIFTRRSLRAWEERPIPEALLREVLAAAMSAPSAGDARPWHFVLVEDRARLEGFIRKFVSNGEFGRPAAAAVVCGDPTLEKFPGFWPQDCSAATENLLLAAHALGLGAVWVAVHPIAEREQALRDALGIPGHVIPLAFVSMGWPAESKPREDRYQESRVHREHWGQHALAA